ITMGSPAASAVSGPGIALTKAIDFPSGDQLISRPVLVRALLFVPWMSAIHDGIEPSALAMIRPDFPSMLPTKASERPSGDHAGCEPRVFSSPTRDDLPVESSRSHSWEAGGPGPSLLLIVYARRLPSGENCTEPTDRSLNRSALCRRVCARAAQGERASRAATTLEVGQRLINPLPWHGRPARGKREPDLVMAETDVPRRSVWPANDWADSRAAAQGRPLRHANFFTAPQHRPGECIGK